MSANVATPQLACPFLTECTSDEYLAHKASIIAPLEQLLYEVDFFSFLPSCLGHFVCKDTHFVNLHKGERLHFEAKPTNLDFYGCLT